MKPLYSSAKETSDAVWQVIQRTTVVRACVVLVARAGHGCVEIVVSIWDVNGTMGVVTKILLAHIVSSHGFTSLLVTVTKYVNKSFPKLISLPVQAITSIRGFCFIV